MKKMKRSKTGFFIILNGRVPLAQSSDDSF
jgi:hypothetical protein